MRFRRPLADGEVGDLGIDNRDIDGRNWWREREEERGVMAHDGSWVMRRRILIVCSCFQTGCDLVQG